LREAVKNKKPSVRVAFLFVNLKMNQSNLLEAGFVITHSFISTEWIYNILRDIEQTALDLDVTGIRHIDEKLNSISAYLASAEFAENAKSYLTSKHQLVRAILFNKTPDTNWYVTWHQDRTVSVSEKFSDPDWKNWSVKEGVLHVQPPLAVLENMVTIRIHLDDTHRDNGCLKVISGSHRNGLLSQDQITEMVARDNVVYCKARAGDALIMRPHLLHASSKSIDPSHRRVLHLEFSNLVLPEGICWN
jgi:ectoine hydroxylase-related dioxygenase (phytanoyl-CoA dioxygenase family)